MAVFIVVSPDEDAEFREILAIAGGQFKDSDAKGDVELVVVGGDYGIIQFFDPFAGELFVESDAAAIHLLECYWRSPVLHVAEKGIAGFTAGALATNVPARSDMFLSTASRWKSDLITQSSVLPVFTKAPNS